jgi:hypothetical protein
MPTTYWSGQHHRLYDPRTPEFENSFLNACRAVLASYAFDGLFLDNCTVFQIANPLPSVHAEMIAALQRVLIALRQEFPNALIVGNSRESWRGLNGEMNEGRSSDLMHQINASVPHNAPSMNMYLSILKDPQDASTVRLEAQRTIALGAFYGANVDSTKVLWFEEFDEIKRNHRLSTP